MNRRRFFPVLTVLLAVPISSEAKERTLNLTHLFTGFQGTFVLHDRAKNIRYIHNKPRSIERFSPCSTFKIPNSLIGLETAVIPDENFVIPWNGTPYPFDAWNRDHTLASALKYSVVWYYQELARRVGEKPMQKWLDRIDYGNRDISGGIDRFWLGSSMKISASEQVDFIGKLQAGRLPFSKRSMEIVRRIMIQEETFWSSVSDRMETDSISNSQKDRYVLRGKTGSNMKDGKWILGWFVGWIECDGNPVYFAVNISSADGASGAKAREIALAALKELGYIR